MHSKKIPYDHRRPANEEVFVGRNTIVNQMVEGLRAGHSYGLVGEAGMGKTSILDALKRKLTSTHFKGDLPVPIPIYIEIKKSLLKPANRMFEAILSKFINALTEQHGLIVPGHKSLLEYAQKGELEEPLRILAGLYYQQQSRSCRFIILLDDMHRGLHHSVLGELVSILRPLVSPNNTVVNMAVVLSGELPLEQEFREDVSSLRGLLSDTVRLEPLFPNDVAALIEVAEGFGWPVEAGCEEAVFTVTKGYPFKLHYYLFMALNRYGRVDRSVLETISEDRDMRDYLNTVLKQATAAPISGSKGEQSMSQDIQADVFLCHNNRDKPEVKKIGKELKRRGIKPWLDEWDLQPGLPWQRALADQITNIKSAAVFVGKDGIGPWQNMELEAFLIEFARRGCPVIPVLLADAPDKPQLPIFLHNMTWVDFRKQEPDPIKQLIWGITSKNPSTDS